MGSVFYSMAEELRRDALHLRERAYPGIVASEEEIAALEIAEKVYRRLAEAAPGSVR